MTQIIKSAKRVNDMQAAFRCPICEGPLQVSDLKSVICSNNHTFDFTRQGYLNFLTRPSCSQYGKELFEARHKIIAESHFYSAMHETMTQMIEQHLDLAMDPLRVVDLGCGEGSHLQKLRGEWKTLAMSAVGLDLSKEGILMAAKRYGDNVWLIGDLARSPLADQSFHLILNILSPANYKEFKRILAPDGLVMKVVPGSRYLVELREALFADRKKKVYKNDETILLFQKHFHLQDAVHVSYTKKLNQVELKQLVRMTPLAWSADEARMDAFLHRDFAEITVDLTILLGKGCG